ncbi:multidrug resistance-associated protein 1-like [Brevipalpus obovatus]|uniref:multidrug resistance-associated protein 1-like n=1 Tax=Brevipalpus obovatus TaxID=246614 RepID=UPI003D9DC869
MNSFCGHNFWDTQLTWADSSPIFTPCFSDTLLTWIPCGFLWIFGPMTIGRLVKDGNQNLPWTLLNIMKIIFASILTGLNAIELVSACIKLMENYSSVYPVEYFSPLIRILTLLLATALMLLHRRRGVHSSAILCSFWFLLLIGNLINYWTIVMTLKEPSNKYWTIEKLILITRSIQLPSLVCSLVLSSFSDTSRQYFLLGEDFKNECQLLFASFPSRLTFWWYNQMVIMGFRKTLTQKDLWNLPIELKTKTICSKFQRFFSGNTENASKYKLSYPNEEPNQFEQNLPPKINILIPLIKAFWPQLTLCMAIKFVSTIVTSIYPILFDALLTFMGSDQYTWRGYTLAFGIAALSFTGSMLNGQYEFLINITSMRMRSAIIAIIYKKSLKLSSSGRKNFTTGEIINLIAVDAERIVGYVLMYNMLWSAPIQIGIALYLLYQQLGTASLAGIGIMILLIPLNGFIGQRLKTLTGILMKERDKRMRLMSEILQGIKVLKLYAWEVTFANQITEIRNKEIKALRHLAYVSAGLMFAFSATPFLVAIASFATYVLGNPLNVLNANKAFVTLSLLGILSAPLSMLPMVISFAVTFIVSLRRINKFLMGDELDPQSVEKEYNPETPVVVRNCTFTWDHENQPILQGISMDVKAKKLIAIVGHVGSGKSSLLSALLGDLYKIGGKINVSGSIAYVPQSAWIQNATFKQNILFKQPDIPSKYDNVIEACALIPDLEILSAGDATEIGEKGINLSGGQKQRISLARAVYSNADLYLLDDPLSAVDAHVARHLFDKVIGPRGLLKNKTRILVTHRVTFLSQVDEIIVLKNGKISEQGTYNELLTRRGEFADFILQYAAEQSKQDPDIRDTLKEKIGIDITEMKSSGKDSASDMSLDGLRRRTISSSSQRSLRKSSTQSTSLIKPVIIDQPKIGKAKLIEDENAEIGSVKIKVYMEYFRALGLLSCFMALIIFFSSSSLGLLSNLWLTAWSDDALDPTSFNNTDKRNIRLGVYSGLGFAGIFASLANSILINLAILRASRMIHERMLYRVIRAPISFFDTTPSGRTLNRFSKDVDVADFGMTYNLRLFFSLSFRGVFSIIAISLETPQFLVAVVPLGIIYLLVQKFFIASSRQLKRIGSVTRSPVYSHFSETLNGSTSIRAYNRSHEFIEECYCKVDTNHSSSFLNLGANGWLAIRLEFIGNMIIFLVAVFTVMSRGNLTPGSAGFSVTYAATITGILQMLVKAASDLETNIVSIERCFEYTNVPIEAFLTDTFNQPPDDWPQNGDISFTNYGTRYRPGLDLVLQDLNCHIKSLEKIGIVGRTGAGKSSLALALFRLIEPACGEISIDGRNITTIGLHDLRSRLTVIPQDPVLFSGTFRRNIDPMNAHTDKEIWHALEQSHLKNFVSTLDAGLDHEISEGGENLSSGQKQLLCLTRALLRKSKILVFDEATAAVDVETDELIQNTIREEFKDCTIVTIAHRLNTIMDYDRIIFMDKGKIIEFNSPTNLLKNSKSSFFSLASEAKLI